MIRFPCFLLISFFRFFVTAFDAGMDASSDWVAFVRAMWNDELSNSTLSNKLCAQYAGMLARGVLDFFHPPMEDHVMDSNHGAFNGDEEIGEGGFDGGRERRRERWRPREHWRRWIHCVFTWIEQYVDLLSRPSLLFQFVIYPPLTLCIVRDFQCNCDDCVIFCPLALSILNVLHTSDTVILTDVTQTSVRRI